MLDTRVSYNLLLPVTDLRPHFKKITYFKWINNFKWTGQKEGIQDTCLKSSSCGKPLKQPSEPKLVGVRLPDAV